MVGAGISNAAAMFFGSTLAHGEAYAGFNLRNHPIDDVEGRQNAWAMWINQGIS